MRNHDLGIDYGDDGTATLILDRPSKRNAITLEMWRALPRALGQLEDDGRVKVVVLRGRGAEAFCAGADIGEFQSLRGDSESASHYDELVARAERALSAFPKPTIAMVQGPCIGGGCSIAMDCDLRFCDESAVFGITAAKIGLIYGLRSTRRLVQLVGPARAKELLFTGTTIGAQEARDVGLVDRVYAGEDLEMQVAEFARTVAARSQQSVRGAKRMVEMALDGRRPEDEGAKSLAGESYNSEDYREGVRSFMEGRQPNFTSP